MTIAEDKKRICVGIIVGSHGLRGLVKIKSFTVVSEDIFVHGPLTDKDGKRSFALELVSSSKKGLIVKLEGVTTRDASEALRGIELYLYEPTLSRLGTPLLPPYSGFDSLLIRPQPKVTGFRACS